MSDRRAGRVAFEHRDFRLYFAARFVSALALQMQNVALGWLVYAITGKPLALGIVGLVAFLPAVGLSLFTGHVADRFDRRGILLVSYAIMVALFGLATVGFGLSTSLWLSLICLFVLGASDMISVIVRQTLGRWKPPTPCAAGWPR